ncbi:MAG TPA: hypothetical protein VHI71_09010 [Actinomycetota bacterium]|nr:hypothetical protein [Actinomycetota bacterium]
MRKLTTAIAAAALLAVVPATAARAQECTVVYFQDPTGWVTIYIPLCFID